MLGGCQRPLAALVTLVTLLIGAPAVGQGPDPFQSAPGPALIVRPAPRLRPPVPVPQPQAPPPQAVTPAPNLPILDAAYIAHVQQVAQAAGIGMTGDLNFPREKTPPQWQAFVGAWGPGDRISNEQPKGDKNIFVIEAVDAAGYADIVAGWSACCADNGFRGRPGWRRTSGKISGNTIITDEIQPGGGQTRREIELSSDGTLHVKFRLPSEIIQVAAPRVK
jgi:hypothetical protein